MQSQYKVSCLFLYLLRKPMLMGMLVSRFVRPLVSWLFCVASCLVFTWVGSLAGCLIVSLICYVRWLFEWLLDWLLVRLVG